jgi:hypothetical protein
MAGLGLIFFQCCAPVSVQPPISPFDQQQIAHLISTLREQDKRVCTFFSSGRVSLDARDSESEANLLIMGTRDPLKIKFEITHTWGRPLLHALIRDRRVHILSFPEKRYYLGDLGSVNSPVFFPGRLEPDQVWGFLRGYPVIRQYHRAVSLTGNQITLLDKNAEEVQVIDFYPQGILPRMISLPGQHIEQSFEDFKDLNGIYYAQRVRLNRPETETTLAINAPQMIFNKTIPESVFALKIPQDFKVFSLQKAVNK